MNAVQLYARFNAYSRSFNTTVLNSKLNLLKFKPHENIFEVGCGTGSSTRTLLEYIPNNYNKYIATDLQQSMVDQAIAENTNNVQFAQLDISAKDPIKKEWIHQFDKLFSFCAINWVPTKLHTQCFTNINRLLKENGHSFLLIVGDIPIQEAYKDLYKNQKWRPYYKDQYEYISFYNKVYPNRTANLKDALKQTEHEILDMEYMDIDHQFDSMEDFENSLKAINPFVSRIPEHLRDYYWSDLWEAHDKYSDVRDTLQVKTGILFVCTKKIKNI